MDEVYYVAIFEGGNVSKKCATYEEARGVAANMLMNNGRMSMAHVAKVITRIEREVPPIKETCLGKTD